MNPSDPMVPQNMDELQRPQDELDKIDLKQPELSKEQALKWLSRAKTANKFYRKQFMPKYKQAKRRYNSEIGYAGINYSQNATRAKASHTDINLLYRDIKNFISSIFYRNPEIELASRSDDTQEKMNIQNLEQAVNDDIKDRGKEIKSLLRSLLVDENLAAIAGVYIDYEYHDEAQVDEQGQPVMMQGVPQMTQVKNHVLLRKIKPENLVIPPYVYYYNLHESPYLGYVDIVSLESLKQNAGLNQEVVGRIKGETYRSLIDFDIKELDKSNIEDKDDILHSKIYTIFIRGNDGKPIKRLILSEDSEVQGEPLVYEDYDKGHGRDNQGYPIHVLMLNDASDTLIPPSEAWILEPVLQIIDHIYAKMNRHLKKSSTKTFVKVGEGGIEKEEMDKWVRNNDLEVLGIKNLPPGIDVNSIVKQLVDQPLSRDHAQMFELARRIFDELSRQPSFSQPSIINQKKTATEATAIQQTDNTQNGDYIDKFKDFLCDVFYDWAKLFQRNFQGARDIGVVSKLDGQIEMRPNMTRDNLQGEFKADINVTSFLQPNKEMKRRTLKETINDLVLFQPFLLEQGLKVNAKKAVDELLENVEIRNPSAMVVPVPTRTIDQQVLDLVFHQTPMNPEELGEDKQKSLERLTQIFQDDLIMNEFETVQQGCTKPIVMMLQFLSQAIQGGMQGTNQTKPSGATPIQSPIAPSDTNVNAGLLGDAQRNG